MRLTVYRTATTSFVAVVLWICVNFVYCADIPQITPDGDFKSWTLPDLPPSWARNPEGFAVTTEPDATPDGLPAIHIVHKTSTDWAIRIPESIQVERGQVFELTCKIKNVGQSSCQTGVIIYDSKGKALDWSFGGNDVFSTEDWQTVSSKFIVPDNVERIEPRIIGQRDTDVYVAQYEIKRLGKIELSSIKGTLPAENNYLRLVFQMEDASFLIRDVRTGRVWNQIVPSQKQFVLDASPIERGVKFKLLDPRVFLVYTATVQLEKSAPEVVVTISADPNSSLTSEIDYPYPVASKSSDRIVLPVNEGVSFPATETARGVDNLYTYGGHGLCMAFWGIVDDVLDPDKSSGLMGIIETPDDSRVETVLRAPDPDDKEASAKGIQTLAIGCQWQGSMQKFRYDRTLRLVAIDEGGYVAVCKRYRNYAKQIGLLVTFDEKVQKNPELARGIDLLIGAANIWSWDGHGPETTAKLKEIGFDHILWSGGGRSEEISKLNEIPGVLTSRYDIYQDIMDPARYDELPGVHSDWIPEAWPKDLTWDSPDGHWTRGWTVDPKEAGKPRIPCGVLCDSKAVKYARERVGKELSDIPYRARFIDTTVASPWRECWNPDHPLTRTDSKVERMKLLGLFGSEFNLVCGSETGIDASVPYCDFYEGMMSIGQYRCPESGRNQARIWDEVPELVEKYQVGEDYRLPLFELVYHGCVVSYWYWGDYNNKFPSLWHKRDLFNALYGVPPMYGFKLDYFEKNRERFAESYKISEPVSRMTGRVEMTDHRILTADRTVQKTSFANGIEVIVNFGTKDYRCDDGAVVKPESSRIIDRR